MPFLADPDQQKVLDASSRDWLCVRGEAGSGKTTTAMVRARRLATRRSRTLILSPTEALVTHLHSAARRIPGMVDVLAVDRWLHQEAERLVGRWDRAEEAPAAVVRAKRHPAVASIVEATSREVEALARDVLHHLFGDAHHREQLEDEADGALDRPTLEALAAYVEVQFAEIDRDERGRPLLGMDGPVHKGTPLHDADSLDRGDASTLMALGRLLEVPRRRYDHVVVDEAQELSPLELAAAAAAVRPGGALTLAGDAGQQLDPGAWFAGWDGVERSVERPTAHHRLGGTHRCPPEVLAVARAVRSGTPAPRDTLPVVRWTSWEDAAARRAALQDARGQLVAPDAQRARQLQRALPGHRVTIVDELRGRELPDILLPDLSPDGWPADEAGRRALYVALTRATRSVWCGTVGPWSPLLGAQMSSSSASSARSMMNR